MGATVETISLDSDFIVPVRAAAVTRWMVMYPPLPPPPSHTYFNQISCTHARRSVHAVAVHSELDT